MTSIGWATTDWATGAPDLAGHPTLGGAGTYRCGIPAKYLARRGHRTVVGTLVGNQRTGELHIRTMDGTIRSGFEVIVLQRWMDREAPEAVRRAQACGQVVVNDVDDWFWGLSRKNQAHKLTAPTHNPASNRAHYLACLQASDLVTVSTPYLAEQLAGIGVERVAVVRNSLDLAWWTPVSKHQGLSPVFGWVGAIPWRSGDLETLRGILGSFLERHGLRFHHGGHLDRAARAADLLRLPASIPVTLAPLSPIATYPRLFGPVDVGIVPLADHPFNLAKSAIKGMEYAAAGIPFVAADTPEYRWLEQQGCGRVATSPKDWRRHFTALLDPDVRTAEAKTNREVAESLSADRHVVAWERSLEQSRSVVTVRQ